MKHIAIACAALVGLSAIAFAQDQPPAGGTETTPPAAAEIAPGAGPSEDGPPEAGPPEAHRHMMDREHRRHHRREMRRAGRDRPNGAMFSWRTADGSRYLFRCADRDTTQECVDAIMPLIERISPAASATN